MAVDIITVGRDQATGRVSAGSNMALTPMMMGVPDRITSAIASRTPLPSASL